jgi:ATP-dependent DNA helicase RecG
LHYISVDNKISANELAEKIGISSRKIEKNIKKLKAHNILKRIGPAKGGYWQVSE